MSVPRPELPEDVASTDSRPPFADAQRFRHTLPALAGAICAGVFALAFVAAPSSCAWGLETYALIGAIAGGVLALLPFALAYGTSWRARAGCALLCAGAGASTWIGGLFAANVRIICRLF